MGEIGSEFHRMPIENGHGFVLPQSGSLVFSGRTAIEAVLKYLSDAHTVLLPSYCCDSMIMPFRDIGIDVRFYRVWWNDGLKVAIDDNADILLWCNYFGYQNKMPDFDGIIIEDITHSLLSAIPSHPRADYLVASLRKWEPVNCGGYCSVQVDGTEPPEEFVNLKTAAMELKTEYLEELKAEKKGHFLQMFRESNHWLAENYSGLSIDSFSRAYLERVNVEEQRRVRRENAKVLYEGLTGKVQFMFPIEDMDCPLFVPILLPNRDEVRKHLTQNEIYCPVHWPKPEGCESNIYDSELSLICDQRYGIEDMKRIISVIQEVV
ncbi:MAG: hypothetical protein LKE39_05360 [Sphaerochaeta sp.]|jgi:hypothetical protein|nr:hypothetical protein [Sphaerochaeta sp.]